MPHIKRIPPQFGQSLTSPKRMFLTKPSSWAKIAVIISVVIVLFVVNRSPQNVPAKDTYQSPTTPDVSVKPTEPDAQINKNGVVAGVESVRETQQAPQPQEPIKITAEPQKPAGPTKAQRAMQPILGDDQQLESLLKLGKKYLDEDNLDSAEQAFIRATEVAPEYRDAWYLVGFTALKEFQKNPVIQSPDYAVSKLDLAIIYLKRAQTIDPLAQNVKDLLKTAQDIQTNS